MDINRFVKIVKNLTEDNEQPVEKITRDAFLYMDSNTRDFAQCATCWLFHSEKNRCSVLGPNVEVKPEYSCGYFGKGTSATRPPLKKLFTPKEVGLVERKVRCENCTYGGKTCSLYDALNKAMPDKFNLDASIHPKACCNAQTPKKRDKK